MGGVSHSKFEIDEASKQGHWHGAVEIVPSLKAPGFCNLQSMPYGKTADFPTSFLNLIKTLPQFG